MGARTKPVTHWRSRAYLKPPCGKVSMYVSPDPGRVTCPECLAEYRACLALDGQGDGLERLPDGSRPGDHWSGGVE